MQVNLTTINFFAGAEKLREIKLVASDCYRWGPHKPRFEEVTTRNRNTTLEKQDLQKHNIVMQTWEASKIRWYGSNRKTKDYFPNMFLWQCTIRLAYDGSNGSQEVTGGRNNYSATEGGYWKHDYLVWILLTNKRIYAFWKSDIISLLFFMVVIRPSRGENDEVLFEIRLWRWKRTLPLAPSLVFILCTTKTG